MILLIFGAAIGVTLTDRVTVDFNKETADAADTLVSGIQVVGTDSGWVVRGTKLDDFAASQHAHARLLSWSGDRIDDTAGAPDLGLTQPGERTLSGQRTVTRVVPVEPAGYALLQYTRPVKALRETVLTLWIFIVLGVLAGAGLALLAGLAVARQAMRPVSSLTSAAKRIASSGSMTEEIPVPSSHDEIHDLALTLSAAFESLDDARATTEVALDKQRTFVADASHELRTPLTSLISRLEMLEAETEGDAHEDAEASLRSARRMAVLVSDLLMIAKADAGTRDPVETPASQIIETAVADATAALSGHQLTVESDDTILLCEPAPLSRAIRNLIENAVRYGPNDGTIAIKANSNQNGWACTVEDAGPGIPESRRAEVFGRFERAGGDAAGSTGLGLAIVQAVAKSHGGEAKIGDSSLGGALIEISLPQEAVVGSSFDDDRQYKRSTA